jgi:hypothetical protein
MEIVDNPVMLAIPAATEAGLGSFLFWRSLAFALVVGFVAAYPANRWLIARGRGHAVVHHYHGGHERNSAREDHLKPRTFGTTFLSRVSDLDGEHLRRRLR